MSDITRDIVALTLMFSVHEPSSSSLQSGQENLNVSIAASEVANLIGN